MLTLYETQKLGAQAHREAADARGLVTLVAIACTLMTVAAFTTASESPGHAKSLPGIVISAHCGSCPWDGAFERALARSYMRAAAQRGYVPDFRSPVPVIIERYDPAMAHIAVRVWLHHDALYLTSDGADPNAGAALRSLGVRVADAIAGAMVAGATPPGDVGLAGRRPSDPRSH